MLASSKIMLHADDGRGMYESFHFRGTSLDGTVAFWLKHNMLRYEGSGDVWLEGTVVLCDRTAQRAQVVYATQVLDAERFSRLMQVARDWDHVQLGFADGMYVEISEGHLRGRLVGEGGEAKWDFKLRRSGVRLHHFPSEGMYTLPWPRKKLLTRDCRMGFSGQIAVGDLGFDAHFLGVNGHQWGSENAQSYAYANCLRFAERDDAYFDGFSARLALSRWRMTSPWLSMASLAARGRWHHFNSVLRAPRQAVHSLTPYAWSVDYVNDTHRLEVRVDGQGPQSVPWVALHSDQPDRTRCATRTTEFAHAQLRLVRLTDETVDDVLESDACVLETLIPDGPVASEVCIGQP